MAVVSIALRPVLCKDISLKIENLVKESIIDDYNIHKKNLKKF